MKFLIGLLLLSKSFSSFGQSSVVQYSSNYYSAGVNTQTFNYISSIGKQRADNWCWAACIQMVLNYHGLYITQEQVVNKCFGGLHDKPGGSVEMFTALNGWAYNTRGGVSNIYANDYPTNVYEIQYLLANNWPLIVGLNYGTDVGHAYVLTAIYYSLSYDGYGNVIIIPDKVVLRDPSPGSSSRQEMSWADFSTYAVSIYKVWIVDVPVVQNYYWPYGSAFSYKNVFDDKKDFNCVIYSGRSISPYSQLAYVSRNPIPIMVEKSFKDNRIAVRSKLEFFKGKEEYDEYSSSSTNMFTTDKSNYFALISDLKIIWNRKYRFNFWMAPTFGINKFENYKRIESSQFNWMTASYYEVINEQREKLSGISYGVRIGFDMYATRRFYVSSDIGVLNYRGIGNSASDFNLMIGYRFNKN